MGLLNFRLRQTDKNSQSEGVFAANDNTLRGDTSYLKSVIFNGKPKRAFKANQKSKISFQDPKRVHIALYNNEKENYEQEIEKLTKRLAKQQQQSTQMKEVCDQLTVETEDLSDAIQQYQVQINKVKDE